VNDAEKFGTWCGLTCLGGSEQRQCPCVHPRDCAMRGHPDFQTKHRAAGARLLRVAMSQKEARKP
jgi:hypothetical protein